MGINTGFHSCFYRKYSILEKTVKKMGRHCIYVGGVGSSVYYINNNNRKYMGKTSMGNLVDMGPATHYHFYTVDSVHGLFNTQIFCR